MKHLAVILDFKAPNVQIYCKTGNFHDRKISRIRGVGMFANFWLEDFLSFKKYYIFATENFRESAEIRENREIFLHAKISCFTVYFCDFTDGCLIGRN